MSLSEAAVVAVALGCGVGWAPAPIPAPVQPETLVAVTQPGPADVGPIYGFAQAGPTLVWAGGTGRSGRCPPITMRRLPSGSGKTIGYAGGGDELCFEYGFWIAAAGTRALWGGWEPANEPWGSLIVGGPGVRPHAVAGLQSVFGEAGDRLIDVAGDGSTLLYATVKIVPNDYDACFPALGSRASTCRFRVTGGSVERVDGTKAVPVRRVPASAAIAVSGTRLADVPAERAWRRQADVRAAGAVEIRDARTGRLFLTIHPRGEVSAVALSADVLAVLVQEGSASRIDVHDARTGARRSSTSVPARAGVEIAAAGQTVVYSEGKAIRALRAGAKTSSLVARAFGRPFGLSIEGTRVAWAENLAEGRKGLVRAIQLR